MVLDPVDALEEAADPIYELPCALGGGLGPSFAIFAYASLSFAVEASLAV